jgi:hypothetical protein
VVVLLVVDHRRVSSDGRSYEAPHVRRRLRHHLLAALAPLELEHSTNAPKVTFNRLDLAKAGLTRLPCVAVLEARERSGELHLHVQTFFPAVSTEPIIALLERKTAP